jgi:lipid II:glycine glycyltransferase (peptidoglycan interpeptide bridge formation enzyme)
VRALERRITQMNTPAFFQSKLFGEFQKKIPSRGKYWIIERDGRKVCLAIYQKIRFGKSFLWVPYGPSPEDLDFAVCELAKIAAKENAIFARIEPAKTIPCKNFPKTLKRITPAATLVLDLSKTKNELLARMKPKGRYNIKVAQKHGVEVVHYEKLDESSREDFSTFCELVQATASRDSFSAHPASFYKTFFEHFGNENNSASFFAAKHEGEVIAGILVVYFEDTAIYYYGASDHAARKVMAPYLVQWEALSEAKKRGMKWYDFFGIAPEEAKNHPWTGVTSFKKKFGGKVYEFGYAFDLVFSGFWYWLYRMKN